MSKRINDNTFKPTYKDGQIYYAADVNKIINVLTAGVDANFGDIKSIILGDSEGILEYEVLEGSEPYYGLDPNIGQIGDYAGWRSEDGKLWLYQKETTGWVNRGEINLTKLFIDFSEEDIMWGTVTIINDEDILPLEGFYEIDHYRLKENDTVAVFGKGNNNGIYLIGQTGSWTKIGELKPKQVVSVDSGRRFGGIQIKVLPSGDYKIVKNQELLRWIRGDLP